MQKSTLVFKKQLTSIVVNYIILNDKETCHSFRHLTAAAKKGKLNMKNKIVISALLTLALCGIWSLVFATAMRNPIGILPGIITGLAIGVGLTLIFTSGKKGNR